MVVLIRMAVVVRATVVHARAKRLTFTTLFYSSCPVPYHGEKCLAFQRKELCMKSYSIALKRNNKIE